MYIVIDMKIIKTILNKAKNYISKKHFIESIFKIRNKCNLNKVKHDRNRYGYPAFKESNKELALRHIRDSKPSIKRRNK